jgi:hypothetical protein
MLNDEQMFPAEGELTYTFDFTDSLPTDVTVIGVAFTISPQSGSPLSPSVSGQVDDLASNRSTIRVSGVQHGATHVLQGKGTLSNGEIIPKDVILRGFNG